MEAKKLKIRTSILLVLSLLLLLCACETKEEKAYKIGSETFELLADAYEDVDNFATDIFVVWVHGLFDEYNIINADDSCVYIAGDLNISADTVKTAAAKWWCEYEIGLEWDNLSNSERIAYRENASTLFQLHEDDMTSFIVQLISYAYETCGVTEEIHAALDSAKDNIKELDEKYPESEYRDYLRKFYVSTNTMFEWCESPSGTYEVMLLEMLEEEEEAEENLKQLKFYFDN